MIDQMGQTLSIAYSKAAAVPFFGAACGGFYHACIVQYARLFGCFAALPFGNGNHCLEQVTVNFYMAAAAHQFGKTLGNG